MTYCSVCGISYENAERICTSCGSELEKVTEPVVNNHPVNEDAMFNRNSAVTDFNASAKMLDQESQQGKGLIKPYSIELEIDGFHFKYDKPAHNFAKQESKEKVVEFRVTCPDEGLVSREGSQFDPSKEILEELETPEVTIQEPTFQGETSNMETIEPETTGEVNDNVLNLENNETPVIETTDTILAAEPLEAEDIQISTEAGEQIPEQVTPADEEIGTEARLETELFPDFELPEPELENPEEKVILWEDNQHWLGIPLTNQYRISNRSLQIIDRLARKFSEVDLSLISEVKLRQSLVDRIFKTGDLTVFVKHLPDTGLKLTGVRNPERIRRLIEEQIKILNYKYE